MVSVPKLYQGLNLLLVLPNILRLETRPANCLVQKKHFETGKLTLSGHSEFAVNAREKIDLSSVLFDVPFFSNDLTFVLILILKY